MKKVFSIVLAVLLIASFAISMVSCGGGKTPVETVKTTTTKVQLKGKLDNIKTVWGVNAFMAAVNEVIDAEAAGETTVDETDEETTPVEDVTTAEDATTVEDVTTVVEETTVEDVTTTVEETTIEDVTTVAEETTAENNIVPTAAVVTNSEETTVTVVDTSILNAADRKVAEVRMKEAVDKVVNTENLKYLLTVAKNIIKLEKVKNIQLRDAALKAVTMDVEKFTEFVVLVEGLVEVEASTVVGAVKPEFDGTGFTDTQYIGHNLAYCLAKVVTLQTTTSIEAVIAL
jgi:hypothetical protein